MEVFSFTENLPGHEVVRSPRALLRYNLAGTRIDSLGETAGGEGVSRVIDDRPSPAPRCSAGTRT